MPYLLQTDIEGDLPPQFLIQALDDDNDGFADFEVWEKVETSAREEIDGTLGQRFGVPFSAPIPPVVKAAMRVLVMERIYLRRGFSGENNPWSSQASETRKKLNAIAQGEQPLTPDINRAKPSVTALTEPAKTSSRYGHIPA